MTFYEYWRSSAAYRVRIALNLKGLAYDPEAIHLTRDGGDQHTPAYRAVNPQGLIPALKLGDGTVLIQSLAIIEYLDETIPEPRLLPGDAIRRAEIRALAEMVACDIHPLNNLRVLQYLKRELGQTQDSIDQWYRHWVVTGFAALEAQAARHSQPFLCGDTPTLADICLVPQMYNARRFATDLTPYPRLVAIDAAATALPAFAKAAPEEQPDAV
ncbi:maleylacetoacetate isomerase [Govanella unica]|uniref:Maleylacetoacetate isomerase n=1 Tax=Govanella unica TaxID=2975056 RepID=A0A9X3TZI7_9PROT|nr:maleylacetoacetate isomerase [Govania unica]